jgi:hypothetical protein
MNGRPLIKLASYQGGMYSASRDFCRRYYLDAVFGSKPLASVLLGNLGWMEGW